MKLKENIKSKVDKLNYRELRIVEQLIDSLTHEEVTGEKTPASTVEHYNKVIELLGENGLSTKDIDQGRKERI